MTDPTFLAILGSLLAMLANKPGRAQLVWLFAGSMLSPVLAALALLFTKDLEGSARWRLARGPLTQRRRDLEAQGGRQLPGVVGAGQPSVEPRHGLGSAGIVSRGLKQISVATGEAAPAALSIHLVLPERRLVGETAAC